MLNLPDASARSSILRFAVLSSLTLLITGCSQQDSLPPIAPPAPAPLVIAPHPAAATQTTTASWYGPRFHGHRTSTGERFDQSDLTAASRTLPLGSHARVTNLSTGKSVVVRINDRGPYVHGRGIDLSRAAAKRIGMDHRGLAQVKVTRVDGHSEEVKTATHHHPHVSDVDFASRSYPASEASLAR